MEIKTILNKLNYKKPDLKSVIIYTKKAVINIEQIHIFFETRNKYNISLINYKTQQKQIFFELTKEQIINKLKRFKIKSYEI